MKPYSKKYFKDYKAVDVPDRRGGTKKVLRYVGDLYSKETTEPARWYPQKRLFLCAAVLCDVAFILAVTRNIESNRSGLLSVLGLALIFPLFFMSIGCVRNMWIKKDMTRDDYRGSVLFIRYGSAACALIALANAVWQGIYTFVHAPPQDVLGGSLALAGYAIIAVVSALLCFFALKMRYEVVKGRNKNVEPNRHEYE